MSAPFVVLVGPLKVTVSPSGSVATKVPVTTPVPGSAEPTVSWTVGGRLAGVAAAAGTDAAGAAVARLSERRTSSSDPSVSAWAGESSPASMFDSAAESVTPAGVVSVDRALAGAAVAAGGR